LIISRQAARERRDKSVRQKGDYRSCRGRDFPDRFAKAANRALKALQFARRNLVD